MYLNSPTQPTNYTQNSIVVLIDIINEKQLGSNNIYMFSKEVE